jgi:poly(ADP-ribose) glycohydrolase ARH3
MANQFVKNYQPSRGYGYGTIKALNAIKANQPPPFDSLGNGSAMRIAPIGLFYFDDPVKQAEVAKESSAITHSHPLAKDACWLLARAIGLLLIKKEKGEILKELGNISPQPYKDRIKTISIAFESKALYYPSKLGIDSTALNSIPVTLYSFFLNSSFKEALIYSINLGGDTDTLGAMCGALAGSYWGINEIPSNWLDKLEDREYIKELAEKLFKLKAEL